MLIWWSECWRYVWHKYAGSGKCTAVNNIVLEYAAAERAFRFVLEGLQASMRGNVNECYTGGEISCTEKNQQYLKKSGVFLCLGGINGGILSKMMEIW